MTSNASEEDEEQCTEDQYGDVNNSLHDVRRDLLIGNFE